MATTETLGIMHILDDRIHIKDAFFWLRLLLINGLLQQ